MQRLHYSSGSIITGESVGAEVLRYAAALAPTGRSDVIDIPATDDSGATIRAYLVIGPTSELLLVDEPEAYERSHDQSHGHPAGQPADDRRQDEGSAGAGPSDDRFSGDPAITDLRARTEALRVRPIAFTEPSHDGTIDFDTEFELG